MAYYVKIYPYTQASIDITYRFVCEHCGKDSGIKTAKAFGLRKGGEPVPEGVEVTMADAARLRRDAKKSLEETIDRYKARIGKGKRYPALFVGHCSHCQKTQSWSGDGALINLLLYPFSFFIITLVVMLILNVFVEAIGIWKPPLIAGGAGLIIGLFIVSGARLTARKAKRKNKPQIFWPDLNFARISQ
jgi:hypothetical protein